MFVRVGEGGELVEDWDELVPVGDLFGDVDVASGLFGVVGVGGEPFSTGGRRFTGDGGDEFDE